jgi:hypothetical protein
LDSNLRDRRARMPEPKSMSDQVIAAGKTVLATDVAQGVIGAVADKMEDAAKVVKEKAAEAGGRKPSSRKSTTTRKTGARKTGARKTGARKTGARKAGARKTGARKTGAQKASARTRSRTLKAGKRS